MKRKESWMAANWYSTKRFLLSIGLLSLLVGCGGEGFGCPGAGDTEPPPNTDKKGIFIGDGVVPFPNPFIAIGETLELPVTIQKINASDTGATTITPRPITGITFNPPAITVDVPAIGTVTRTFQVVAGPAAVGSRTFEVSRTGPPGAGFLNEVKGFEVSDKLASATISPVTATVDIGSTKTFDVSILPRGDSEGTITLAAVLNAPDLTYSPHSFTVNLVKNSTTPIVQTITVTAPPNAQVRTTNLRIRQDTRDLCFAQVSVLPVAGGDPTFAIAASATQVTAPNGGFSQPITFTVSSVNGFTGPLRITWITDGAILPDPIDNNFDVNISPTSPATFTRRLRRQATHNVPIPITFQATDLSTNTSKSVTIEVSGTSG